MPSFGVYACDMLVFCVRVWRPQVEGGVSSSVTPTLFFFNFLNFILCVWVFCLHVHVCTTCVPGACGGWKRTLDPLKLKLQVFVRHDVGARI